LAPNISNRGGGSCALNNNTHAHRKEFPENRKQHNYHCMKLPAPYSMLQSDTKIIGYFSEEIVSDFKNP